MSAYKDFLKEYRIEEDLLDKVVRGLFSSEYSYWLSVESHYNADVSLGFSGSLEDWIIKRLVSEEYVLVEVEDEYDPYDLYIGDLVDGFVYLIEDESLSYEFWDAEDYSIIFQYAMFSDIRYEREL